MVFILVNDLLAQNIFLLQFTGNKDPSFFVKCVDFLKQKYNMENLTYTINLESNSCKVYKQVQVLRKGWVWNSTENRESALFTLNFIECETNPHYEESSTQTENNQNYTFYDNLLESDDDEPFDNSCDVMFGRIEPQDMLSQNFSSDFTVGTGYANTVFFPNSFTFELQQKLSLPNNGLRSTNYNVM